MGPTVRVLDASGTDTTFVTNKSDFLGGVPVALGDVNGDGILDIVTGVGPGGNPFVRIWNGATLAEIGSFFAYDRIFQGGVNVAAGDVNGDGRDDIITGAGPGGGPHVRVWDGATFTEIAGFFAYDPAFPGGVNVAAGDINGDGLADIVTGAGPGAGPSVRVWSGATLAEIGGFYAYDPAFPGGVNVATGDIDGDGLADVVTGAGPGGGPHVRVWSGATLTEIGGSGFFAYDPAFPGGVRVGLSDLDRNGRNEIVTGPADGVAVVRIWSGTTYTMLGEYVSFDSSAGGTGVFIGSTAVNPSPDDAPRITATTPANGATTVDVSADLVVTFSEVVNVTPSAFQLTCGSPIPLTITTTSPSSRFTLHPASPLPVSSSCTLRIIGSGVTDDDAIDPPDRMAGSSTVSFTTSGCPTITVTPTTIPGAYMSLPYGPVTFAQTGGTAPISWSVTAGTLPTGMNFSAAGVLSGTPTQYGAFPLPVTATAVGGCAGSVSPTLNVGSGPNVAPSFIVGPNPSVLEDAGAQTVAGWATSISAGPPYESGQTVTFSVTGNTNAALFAAGPAVSPNGTLTYTPAANANGTATITLVLQDNGGTAIGGVDTSAPQSFTITVTAVNDAPSFTIGPDQVVPENEGPQTIVGWATALSTGPPNESAQTLSFTTTGNTNQALFSASPLVSPTGTLTYTPAPNANGTATITLSVSDNGGTANGGANTSSAIGFSISVGALNGAPSFVAGANQTVLEDTGAQTVAGWASGIDRGGPDEAGQALTFNVTGNTNPSLFSVAPAVSPTGTLTYTPAPNANGTATITLTLSDDGGTANGGVDTSAPQSFTITVTAVNDAPGFIPGGNRISAEDAGALAFANWATAISAGPADEAAQALAFAVTGNTNPALFTLAPAVSPTGTLTYASAPNTFGSATITVVLQDSGGTASGGVDTSAPVTFTITVTPFNDAPVLTTPTIAYATAGNTQLHVAGATRPGVTSIADGSSILTKSAPTDIDGPSPLTVVPFSGATPNGTVTILANGSFTYVPAIGFNGTDTFTFQVTDSATPVTGTINITVTHMVWYVNNQTGPNNAAGGDGRSTNAFETLAAAVTASGANHTIFVFNGISATTPLVGGIQLKQGTQLHGEGIGLSLDGFGTLVPAGTRPRVESAGNTVGVTANTANGNRTGIQIRGLNLRSTGANNAIDVTSANAANLEVRISENTIAGAGAEGIDINQGSTGTATLAVHDNTVTSTGAGIDIRRPVSTGTVTITAFDDNIVTGATVGAGIIVVGTATTPVTFDAMLGGALDVVSGGTTRIGQAGDGVGNAGMTLTQVIGSLQFDDLDIFSDSAGALLVTGTGAFTGAAGTRIAVTAGAGSLAATAGQGLSLNTLTADLSLASLTVTSSPSTGVLLTTVSGTVAAPAGSIASTTGISVSVNGGDVALSYGGSITQTAAAAMVSVVNHTTGAVAFGGTLNATNGTGLLFNNADSTASYSFPGTVTLNGGDAGIDIITGSTGTFIFGANTTITNPTGTAFLLTGSNADVVFSGSITDTTGFAVDIDNHDAGTVTFQTGSITSTGTGTGIRVANSNGGTINFNSPTIALTTGASAAVTLNTANAGGTINFNPAGGNGLDISTTTGTGFSALGGGTITVQGAGNTITSTTGPAINMLNVLVGAGGISFATTTSGGGANGVRLASVTGGPVALGGGSIAGTTASAFLVGDGAGGANTGGTSAITYGGTVTSTGTIRAVDIQDRPAGAGNITLSGQVTHATGNAVVIFLDSNAAGTITFSGAGSVLNSGTSAAVSLTNNTGATINFTGGGLDIDTTTGTGFLATGGGTIAVQGAGNTIVATTGPAMNMLNVVVGAGGINFATTTSGGGANGVRLGNLTGGAVALGSGSIAATTATAFLVGDGAGGANTGGTSAIMYAGTITSTGTIRAVDIQDRPAGAGNITLSGTITHTTGNAIVIFLDSNAAGTITFSGAGSVLNSGTSAAVSLTNNTGATILFTGGGLDIDTTTGTGFLATGGGTIAVLGTGNTIFANGSGTALRIVNTAIGASDVTFQSISAGTAVASAGTGILLDTTGSLGGLTITGTGLAGSGGTIQNKTGADGTTAGTGVYLNNTFDVQLAWMQLNGFQNHAIRGLAVNRFTLTNTIINGTNGSNVAAPFNDGSIRFTELTGAATISNCSIAGAAGNNLAIVNTGGMLDRLTVTGTTFGTMSATTGQNAVSVESQNSAVINMTVQSSTFTAARGDHIARLVNSSSASDTVITGNTITNSLAPPVGGGVAIRLTGGNNTGINPSATFTVSNNTMRGSRGPALTVNRSGGNGTWSGTIANNGIGVAGASGSGSLDGSGIYVIADGTGTYTAAITGNTVRQYDNHGILAQAGISGVAGSAPINLTVTGNIVTEPEPVATASATNGFQLDAGTTAGDAYQVCLALSGNTLAGSGQESTPASGVAQDVRVRQRQSTTVRLPGYAGGATDVAAVVVFLQGQNPGGETGLANIGVPPGGGFVGGAACQIP